MGWSNREINMEQFLVGMLSRQGRVLWVDFNDWENKANENYFNGKNEKHTTFSRRHSNYYEPAPWVCHGHKMCRKTIAKHIRGVWPILAYKDTFVAPVKLANVRLRLINYK